MADSKSQKEYNEQLRQTGSLLASLQREMGKMADAADKRNKKLEQYYSLNKKILGDLDGEEKARKKIEKIDDKLLSLGIKRRKSTGSETKEIDEQISKLESKRSSLESSIGTSLSLENINDRLIQLSQLQNDLSRDNLGVNEDKKKGLQLQMQAQEEVLKKHRQELQILGSVNGAVDGVENKFTKVFDTVDSTLRKIPLIGDILADATKPFTDGIKSEIKVVSGKFKEGFSKNFLQASKESGSFTKAFKSGMSGGMAEAEAAIQGLGGSLSRLGPLLANPIALAIAAVVAIGVLGVIAYNRVAKAAKQFRQETGLLNSQTQEIGNSINSAYRETVILGASMEEVAKAAAEFTNEFDGLEQPSAAVLTNVMTLNKNFGIGVSESVKLNKVFQNMAGLSAEQAQYQISQVASAAKLAGVAPQKVIKDMADSSEYAYKYFGGSVEALGEAAVQAAKLGTSIAQAGKVADNLLDFQNSISSELEAQAMLGVRLDFSQARYLAANGKVLESQQAILDQVQENVDLTRLNTYEQEALAKAAGMPIADLKNQIRIRERFGKLDKEQMAAAMDLLKSGKDLSKVSQEDLQRKTAELNRQREMQSELDNMKNQLKGIGNSLLQVFMPIGKVLMTVFSAITGYLMGVWGPIGRAINRVMEAFKPLGDIFKDLFGDGAGLASIFELIGKIISGPVVFAINQFANGVNMVVSFIKGVYDIVKGIFTLDLDLILNGFKGLGEGILRFFFGIPIALYNSFLDIFPALGDWFSSLIDSIKQKLTGLLPSWAQRALGVGKSDASEVQQQAVTDISVTQSGIIRDGGSVNDGVVQGGTIVSTDPADFLIATKNPNGLAEELGGNGGSNVVDMSGVIEELKSLKEAYMSNKDVYMDRVKVSSEVTTAQERSGRENRFGLQGA